MIDNKKKKSYTQLHTCVNRPNLPKYFLLAKIWPI